MRPGETSEDRLGVGVGTRSGGWAQLLLVRGLSELRAAQPHTNSPAQAF